MKGSGIMKAFRRLLITVISSLMIFSGVCVQRCPPLNMAGNDVPDYPISFTYSNYSDSDSPSWNEAIGSMTSN